MTHFRLRLLLNIIELCYIRLAQTDLTEHSLKANLLHDLFS